MTDRDWPIDAQSRISRQKAAFVGGRIVTIMKIQQLNIIGKRLKSVGKTTGDQQTLPIVGAEVSAEGRKKRGRAATKVDSNVVNLARQTGHELGFIMRRQLEMQASHSAALSGAAVIYLSHWAVPSPLFKNGRFEYPTETAP
nr:hypothetical protein [Qipengyuania aquimaris]